MDKINWIASYPKSGNTWVRLFLNAYRLGVCHINDNVGTTGSDTSSYVYQVLSPQPLHALTADEVFFLRHAALLHLMTNRMSIPTIVKTHVANIEIGTVRMIPPPLTNKAVYLVRDPRDVCVSFAKHLNKTIDETILYMDNRDFMIFREGSKVASPLTTWSTHVESWERDFVTVIKYEDLKNNPEENFAKILDTFGIKLDKQKLKKSIRLCELEKLKKQEEKQKFIELGKQDKFFGQGTGWINTLTEKQIKRIEEDHGEIMRKYGYEFYKKSPHLKSIKTG